MNIDWIIPCRYAEVHDNLATIIGAGIDTFWVPQFPATIQVLVAVRLLATKDELGPEHEHTTRNIIRNGAGDIISDLSSPFKAGAPTEIDSAHADWLNGIELITLIQFAAPDEGTYTFEHVVDASSKAVPLHVRRAVPAT